MFIGIFNTILGIVMILIGLKIYRPFKPEKEEVMMRKFKTFYLIGGLGLLAWGLFQFFQLV